jgi:predicted NAD-dependent protein-ADP-ribosyltransferase YbiA (DUF1768 family)
MVLLFYSSKEDNYFLGNFYPHVSGQRLESLNIQYKGTSWPTSEHLYQALKFKNKTEKEKKWREIIRTSSTPTIARHLGHQLTDSHYEWQRKATSLVNEYIDVRKAGDIDDIAFREKIMMKALKAKFSIVELREKLLNTKNLKLGEKTGGLWGFYGSNLLGRLLERLRLDISN